MIARAELAADGGQEHRAKANADQAQGQLVQPIRHVDIANEVSESLNTDSEVVRNVYITTQSGVEIFAALFMDCTGGQVSAGHDTSPNKDECSKNLTSIRTAAMAKYNASQDKDHHIIWPKNLDNSIDVRDTFQVLLVLLSCHISYVILPTLCI